MKERGYTKRDRAGGTLRIVAERDRDTQRYTKRDRAREWHTERGRGDRKAERLRESDSAKGSS